MIKLEEKLGYSFQDRTFLETALTHSSYANENRQTGAECNERLEFLGDALLGMVTADRLYRRYPGMPEGRMTRLRAELVCEQSLASAAAVLDLGAFLYLGKGEEQTGGRSRSSILADAMEAVLAAVYCDGGLTETARIIDKFILAGLEEYAAASTSDYKTELQELVQRKGSAKIAYQIVDESGPDHDKTFTAQVLLEDKSAGQGRGRTKKEAEQAAAKDALAGLRKSKTL